MPAVRQAKRILVDGDQSRVAEVLRTAKEPVVFEEAGSEAFQELRSRWTDDYLAETLGGNTFTVRYFKSGEFQMDAMQVEQAAEMSMKELLGCAADQELAEYYGILHLMDAFAKPLFDDLAPLKTEIATLAGSPSDVPHVIWIGGARNVTPLHYDPVSRLHGVLRGTKTFTLYPADRRHIGLLEAGSLTSRRRRHSSYGTGPLDEARFPKLRKTKPVEAHLGPGDFLYIPLCWWHLVSIPDELTISFAVRWFPLEFHPNWAFWRYKLGCRFFEPDNA